MVLGHFRRDAEKPRVEVDVADPEHKNLFWPDQVFEAQPDHRDISVHTAFVEVAENSPAVLFRDGDPAFGLLLFRLERGKWVVRGEAAGDKRPEQAFQELEHTVECAGASSSSVFVENLRRLAAGEAPAEPVRYAGFLAPSGEERQFGPVAAHGVLAEVFLLLTDEVCGRLHNGDPFRGGGIFASQRVPAVVEFSVDFRAEQGRVSLPFPGTLDTVAAYAHPLEFVAGGVKHVVKDVGLFVLSDLGGSEIDERYCHK